MTKLQRMTRDADVQSFFRKLDRLGINDEFHEPDQHDIVSAKIMGTVLDNAGGLGDDEMIFILKKRNGRSREWFATINVCDLVALARVGYKSLTR